MRKLKPVRNSTISGQLPRNAFGPHALPHPQTPYVRVTRWRRRRFFAVLAETGTVKVAAELAGLGIGAVYRLRKLEPGGL